MKVAVVGGGINGVMSAWALALFGCSVDLFERGELMQATSSRSTKLLHGGLRYLEHGSFGLVREALRERRWWVIAAPEHARPLEILLPVYAIARRPKWKVRAGLWLYDLLAGQASFGQHQWIVDSGVHIHTGTLIESVSAEGGPSLRAGALASTG